MDRTARIKNLRFNRMNDTPDDIKQKQLDIILSKTNGERLEMGLNMMQAGYDLTKERVKREHPDASKKELPFLIFEALYNNDVSKEEKKRIREYFLAL